MRPTPYTEWQQTLFPDEPPVRLSKTKPARSAGDDDKPTPRLCWRGPRRDTRHAYDRPGDVGPC